MGDGFSFILNSLFLLTPSLPDLLWRPSWFTKEHTHIFTVELAGKHSTNRASAGGFVDSLRGCSDCVFFSNALSSCY